MRHGAERYPVAEVKGEGCGGGGEDLHHIGRDGATISTRRGLGGSLVKR